MTTKFIAVPPFWTVGQTIDFMREDARLPDEFTELYVVDPRFRFLGTVPLDRLLRSKRPTKIERHHGRGKALGAGDRRPGGRRPSLRALQSPLRRRGRRMPAGSSASSPSTTSSTSSRRRRTRTSSGSPASATRRSRRASSPSCGCGAPGFSSTSSPRSCPPQSSRCLRSTIERIAILAMLFPIVAGLGGNAGTQTLTVTVRAIATQQINDSAMPGG